MRELINRKSLYDPWLLMSAIGLLGMGLVMVTSASLSLAEEWHLPAWHFALHQTWALMGGLVLGWLTTYIPLKTWEMLGFPALISTVTLLAVLLIPGISREVNGSIRWLFLGPISIQVSEFAKLALIIYCAGYLVRREREVRMQISGFLKPTLILTIISGLLLLEPDFGAACVIVSTVMGMLFLGGVPLRRFLALFILVLGALAVVSVASPYRIQRLTSFLDPWSDQYNTGYQLTQSLIAFGRGGWFGAGLGNSVQKLLYLPEPHTDFLYAVLAEELGLVGALTVLLFFTLLVWRIFALGRRALLSGNPFAGYVAYGIALWVALQTLINIGVNVGVLPTKGLTLPFMSYGGCSLIVALVALGLLLRIDFEIHLKRK